MKFSDDSKDFMAAVVRLMIALAIVLIFSGMIWLIRSFPLVGEEIPIEAMKVSQVREFQPQTVELEREIIPLAAEPEDPEPEPQPEPVPEPKNDRAGFCIDPKTDIDDFNACYDELIRRGISECGGEPYLGMIAVFQVMYDRMYSMDAGYASLHDMLSVQNAFASPREGDISPWEPLISEACKAVFLSGERAFDAPVKYFYNPYYSSEKGLAFMESQAYLGRIGDHIFCTEWKYIEGTNHDGINPYALLKEE